ncbi:DUF4058 family protein [Romeria aff. gracilis LEGE 07310]|uniref:DUF4058 family protein n=1 Tax=Vasconcelosia minhoensis LEGE 07310 TaxID=915328 RepID=A0A8J7DK54_9CYAN|nr:DUF4058 family protein [Romeria gracilis]MBE9075966.1 DUF4058 family protein [Romeria aff. gracilis LEGE 07310]
MPSPFPGMDPYLEHPDFWPEVHHWLITLIAETLVPQVRPKYRVAIEKRIYEINSLGQGGNGNSLLVGIPDVSIHQRAGQPEVATLAADKDSTSQPQTVTLPRSEPVKQAYLEIRDLQTGQVVTAIEILSPVNKRPGEGRTTYIQKRQQVLASLTHLVEIDLLRAWPPMPVLDAAAASDYRVLISNSERRPKADWYAIDLQEPLPTLPIPLLGQNESATLNLQALFDAVYHRSGFDYVVDYSREPSPPLAKPEHEWATALLINKSLRD